ncbi:MAG: hypothetical protein DBO99_03075 [gamma proteobacterium symbiont of Ctena orbiculata]|nr:MAG: hypothetical protein DBO99_03075 [gamma proteobacterium symbiont of Ctena orbiculata]
MRCALFAKDSEHVAAHEKQGAHFRILKDNLSLALKGIAKFQQGSSPGWHADDDNPGFLLKQSSFVFVRIPFHLVRLFPSDSELEKIWKIGSLIKTSEKSIMHISGSNAVKKVFSFINDIDFCEYAADDPSKIAESIISLASTPSFSGCCTKIKIADNDSQSPYDSDEIKSRASLLSHQKPDSCLFKMDYLMDFAENERPYEVTNLGIVCDDSEGNYVSVGFDKTFAAQQGQVSAIDLVPTRLDDPEAAGRYVLHLLNEFNKYKGSNDILKMLKRLLSLVRFLLLKDLTERFDILFKNSKLLVESEINEVNRILQYITAPTKQHCLDAFDTPIVKQLEDYRQELDLELQKAVLKEERYFPGGVSDEVYKLIEATDKKLKEESGGRLYLLKSEEGSDV